jgi:cytochrome c peroxidase
LSYFWFVKFLLCIILFFSSIALISFSFKEIPVDTNAKVTLGKKLFSEKILSKDSSISCASCHIPAYAFADTLPVSIGIHGIETTRNTPSVLNMKQRPYFYYDGRAASLEEQSLMPIANENEMGLPIEEAVARLNVNPTYVKLFYQVYKQKPTAKNLSASFAAYENTLETVDSRYDDWANDKIKLTKQEERGKDLFVGDKAKCFDCHATEDFTQDQFKNIGLFNGNFLTDSGRYRITKKESDLGKFKVPGLRNIAVTAPYMHNGIFNTLEEVLRFYNNPKGFFPHQINLDTTFNKPLGLTTQEQNDIIAFLKTLTDKAYVKKDATAKVKKLQKKK